MILTITLNPAVDNIYRLDQLKVAGRNKLPEPIRTTGGKGINTARALTELDISCVAFTVVGGLNGRFIEQELIRDNFHTYYYYNDEDTRDIMLLMHDDWTQTKLIEDGPLLSRKHVDLIQEELTNILNYYQDTKIITINGSVNTDLDHINLDLIHYFKNNFDRDFTIVADISDEKYKNILNAKDDVVDVIRLNPAQFKEAVGKESMTIDEAVEALRDLETQVPYITVTWEEERVLSRGKDGKVYDLYLPLREKTHISPGAGDAFIAGLVAGLENDWCFKEALRTAIAARISNSYSGGNGRIDKEQVESLMKQVAITIH